MKTQFQKHLSLPFVAGLFAVAFTSSHAQSLAYYNFGDAIVADAVVAAPYAATTVEPGVSISPIQFESGWLVVNDQINKQTGGSITVGSQTFNSNSDGTFACIIDDKFTRSNFAVTNEGDARNNTNPGKGLLQLLSPSTLIPDIATTQSNNLGFGMTVTASGANLELTSMVLQAARFNSVPERSWETIELYADTGSGQFLVDTQGPTPISTPLAPVTFDLTSLDEIANGNSVTFRFYGKRGDLDMTGNIFGRELWIDDITLNGTTTPVGSGTFADWLTANPPATGFNTDSDNDGVSNGVENLLGTDPNEFSQGLTQVSATANSSTFVHSVSATPASDVTLSYQWSTDLVEWKASGETNTGGITATITPSAPVAGNVTVTTSVPPGASSRLFTRLVATQAP